MDTNEQGVEEVSDVAEIEETDSTDWKAEALKAQESAKRNAGIAKRNATKLAKLKTDQETASPSKPNEDSGLMEKAFLRAAQITAEDEVELALTTAKKWGMSIDKLVDDEDFQVKLEKIRTAKSNATATSGVKGGKGNVSGKTTVESMIAATKADPNYMPPEGTPFEQIAEWSKAFSKSGGSGNKKFYDD